MSTTSNEFSKLTMTGMIFGIFLCALKIMYILEHPAQPAPKEASAVEVIGRYEDGDAIGGIRSNLLVNDAGALKIINIEKGSRLDIMNPLPKYLIKSWFGEEATYTPILADLKQPNREGYFESYEMY